MKVVIALLTKHWWWRILNPEPAAELDKWLKTVEASVQECVDCKIKSLLVQGSVRVDGCPIDADQEERQ